MENLVNDAKSKKSLMNALGNLEQKASSLMDLARFSGSVLEKLNDPRPVPNPKEAPGDPVKQEYEKNPDLIDLFNIVADKIDKATQIVGNNTEQINSIIE